MKILYDISVLGSGFINDTSRTGVFRVVEEIARQLTHRSDQEVTFYAEKNLRGITKKYLDHSGQMGSYVFIESKANPKVPILLSNTILSINEVLQNIEILAQKSGRFSKSQHFRDKAVHRLLEWTNVMVQDISENDLAHIDLFHSTFYSTNLEVFLNKKIPVVQTIYDLIPVLKPEYFNHQKFKELLLRILDSLANYGLFICISESTRNDLLNNSKGIDPNKVIVAPLAASNVFFPCKSLQIVQSVRDKFGIPPDARYILSVATLEPRKNLATLVKSFKEILKGEKITDLYLVLAGTLGWKYSPIKEEINSDPILSRYIIQTNYVQDQDLSPLYSGAMAFVYPSLYEGFGLPPLEAMKCGTPVIVSNTSSLPEVVGNAAIMVHPLDQDGFSQSILKLYYNESLRKQMSLQSIERAAIFSWENTLNQVLKAYQMAVSK